MKNQDLINVLKVSHEKLVGLAKRFPEDKRNAPLFDGWSLLDILAHFSGWNKLDAYNTECVRDGKNFEWVSDEDDFNANEVEKRKGLAWDKIFDEFDKSGQLMVEIFQMLPDDVWDKPCGPEGKHSPRSFLKSHAKHYRDSHIPAVEEVLKRLQS